jgi:hypothetical protein
MASWWALGHSRRQYGASLLPLEVTDSALDALRGLIFRHVDPKRNEAQHPYATKCEMLGQADH